MLLVQGNASSLKDEVQKEFSPEYSEVNIENYEVNGCCFLVAKSCLTLLWEL